MDSVPEWPTLVLDLLVEIASKSRVLEDFTAMRGVCRSWRAAAVRKDKVARVSKIPLLLLPDKYWDVRDFYILYKRRVCMRVAAPQVTGKRCLDAGFGWILTAPLSNSGGQLNLIRLQPGMMNPKILRLPKFPGGKYDFKRAVLSANPSETSDFVLMVLANQNLGFWRDGNDQWMLIDQLSGMSMCFFKQKFYIIDSEFAMWIWDSSDGNTNTRGQLFVSFPEAQDVNLPHLVESIKGELLLVMQRRNPDGKFERCEVRRVNMEKMEWEAVKDTIILDGDAIFIGLNSTVCVAADEYPGLIAFTSPTITRILSPAVLALDRNCWTWEHTMLKTRASKDSIIFFHIIIFHFSL